MGKVGQKRVKIEVDGKKGEGTIIGREG